MKYCVNCIHLVGLDCHNEKYAHESVIDGTLTYFSASMARHMESPVSCGMEAKSYEPIKVLVLTENNSSLPAPF